MRETQQSITDWANTNFGKISTMRSLARIHEEVSELLKVIVSNGTPEQIVMECADIAIVSMRAVTKDCKLHLVANQEINTIYGPCQDLGFYIITVNKLLAKAIEDSFTLLPYRKAIINSINRNIYEMVTALAILCHILGHKLGDAIDQKMTINYARKWRRDGTGSAYHE